MSKVAEIRKELKHLAKTNPYTSNMKFFKDGEGEYGAHDKILGVRVPDLRKLAKLYKDISFKDLRELIKSPYNDERALALFILTNKYDKGDKALRCQVFDFYIKNIKGVNNWNLVDVSAHLILGRHIHARLAKKSMLDEMVKSDDLWIRRIAMVSTWWLIREGEVNATFKLAKALLGDEEDLIHKATGWMMREAGKKDIEALKDFLSENIRKIPRTALRYSIERFPEDERQYYLKL